MSHEPSLFLRLPLLVPVLFASYLAGAAEPLDSITRIRSLPTEVAARNLPVAVEVTVTFYDPPRPSLLAHDGREGIFVSWPPSVKEMPRFTVGSRLRIEGVTQPGGFLPIIEARHITVLGEGPLPEPKLIDGSQLFSPSLDCQWVQVPAVITSVENENEFAYGAEVAGWTVKLLLPHDVHPADRATELMQRPVTIRGVVGSVFNAERQLTGRHFFVPSFAQIVPSEAELPDDGPKLRAINELLRADATSRSRVRVIGVVTWASGERLYMRGAGGSIRVRTAKIADLAPGMRIEAEGFAAIAPFRPVLRATRVTTLDQVAPPQPKPLDLSLENILGQQAELVTVNATFLSRRAGPAGEVVLQCQADKWFFEALPARPDGVPENLSPNDRVRLTGICELTATNALPFASAVDGFRLHLRGAEDVVILRHAPWWTLSRLLWALASVAAVALVAVVWVALLRRRVAEQTQIIGAQIERAAVQDERQRVARELHDTIEQELAGLSAQLRNARQRLARTPDEAGMAIELAERMLRHCREEARTSIRDLRSVALQQGGLRGALEEVLTPMASEAGARFAIEVQGVPRSLAGPVEVHLLRIAQQAVANAVQHAAPHEIRLRLEYAADAVTIEIHDDGCGFDSAAPAPRGHFGILGIRERANKIHAALTIDSEPGSGTTIRVVVPADPASPTNGQIHETKDSRSDRR